MNVDVTREFPGLLPGMVTAPASRGSPRGCPTAAVSGGSPETAASITGYVLRGMPG